MIHSAQLSARKNEGAAQANIEGIAAYIADMSKQLSGMAMGHDMQLVAALLSLAALEARRLSEPAASTLMSAIS